MKRQERHELEQYFFDPVSVERVVEIASFFDRPCLLCAPTIGSAMAKLDRPATTLDIDDRFADVPGFRRWDLTRPTYLQETFDLIICDPPFLNVSLRELRQAIRVLSHFDNATPLMVSYPIRRKDALLRVFADFEIVPTGFRPKFATLEASERGEIEFFANFALPL